MNHFDRGSLVGRVVSVSGSRILVLVTGEIAGVEPIWNGKLHSVGQVGTLMKLPQGGSRLLAIVSSLSVAPSLEPEVADKVASDARHITLDLVGEIDGVGEFSRGVSQWPGIDDPVHFVLSEDVVSLYPAPNSQYLAIGKVSSSMSVTATLDLGKLVSRHSAIVGSTGSGKSSAVASLLQSVARGPWPSASIVVFDAHGEYSSALGDNATVIDLKFASAPVLPYWLLPAQEILEIYCPNGVTALLKELFTDLVLEEKRKFAALAPWVVLPANEIGIDTPIPFDLRNVWYALDKLNRETFSDGSKLNHDLIDAGAASDLRPSSFNPATTTNSAPYKGPHNGKLGALPDQMKNRLADPELAFLREGDLAEALAADPLPGILRRLLPLDKCINIVDTSGVASRVAQQVVGAILGLLFELAKRRTDHGLGRDNPVLAVIDEAHRYFTSEAARARSNMERISREGRKYGVGLMLVTQRPSELPATALSQLGTIIGLRLNNHADQAIVSSSMPDGLRELADILPSLRNGEAIVAGESISMPSRVQLTPPNPWPAGDDPDIESWTSRPKRLDLEQNIADWRALQ